MDKVKPPLLQLRKKCNLRQSQIALLLGCSQGHISDLEKGYVDIRPEIIEALRDLGLDANEIVSQHEKYMSWRKDELRKSFTGGT